MIRLIRIYTSYRIQQSGSEVLDSIRFIKRTRFSYEKLQKGIIPQKIVGGILILVLCIFSDNGLYFSKFHENILNGIEVMERTRKVNRRTDGKTD